MFNLPTTHKKKSSGVSPIAFLLGGAIGAAGAYFFLTEKGVAQRKQAAIAAKELPARLKEQAGNIKQRFTESREQVATDHPVLQAAVTEHSAPSDKAHNMVSHLRQPAADTPENEPQ